MSKLHVFKNAEISTTEQMNSQGGTTREERRRERVLRLQGVAVRRIERLYNRNTVALNKATNPNSSPDQVRRYNMILDRNESAINNISQRIESRFERNK